MRILCYSRARFAAGSSPTPSPPPLASPPPSRIAAPAAAGTAAAASLLPPSSRSRFRDGGCPAGLDERLDAESESSDTTMLLASGDAGATLAGAPVLLLPSWIGAASLVAAVNRTRLAGSAVSAASAAAVAGAAAAAAAAAAPCAASARPTDAAFRTASMALPLPAPPPPTRLHVY